jgi:hypothetical protein
MSDDCEKAMTVEEAKRILGEEDAGYLSLCRDGEPYGVPVSYAMIDGRVVFHCALKGRKLDFIRANPKVSFAVSRHPDRARPHHPEKGCSYRYESVICSGKAVIVEDLDERFELLSKFLACFNLRLGRPAGHNAIKRETAEKVACVVIEPENISGRKKMNLKV